MSRADLTEDQEIFLRIYCAAIQSPALQHCIPAVFAERLHEEARRVAYQGLAETKRMVPKFVEQYKSDLCNEEATKADWLKAAADARAARGCVEGVDTNEE